MAAALLPLPAISGAVKKPATTIGFLPSPHIRVWSRHLWKEQRDAFFIEKFLRGDGEHLIERISDMQLGEQMELFERPQVTYSLVDEMCDSYDDFELILDAP